MRGRFVKKTLVGLAVAFCASSVHAYSDASLASSGGMSVFDRSYEAGQAQSVTGVVRYQRTEPAPAAVIDLSMDIPVVSVEETETEKRYRQTLAELEENQKQLEQARAEAQRIVESAHAEVLASADAKVRILEDQRARIQDQLAEAEKQAARIQEALSLNEAAMAEARQLETTGSMEVARIKQESEQILMMAESSAVAIESAARQRVLLERVDPTVVLNEPGQAEYHAATLEEIAAGLMPEGWRVQVEFHARPDLAERRYQFISTDPRDLALRKLTSSVRDAKVRFAYFWDLTDSAGNPAPMLLITDRAN